MAQYIDKSALVAEIEKRISSLESIGSENYLHDNYPVQYAMLVTLKSLRFSIDILEVKDVKLTEEDMKLIWTIGDDIPYMAEEEFYKELLKRYKAHKEK